MIRINAIPNTKAAKAYYCLSDYLIEGHETPAQWYGKGAEMLGLRGNVDQNVFEMLCDNINPTTGKQLTAKTVANRRVGYDFTFSPSKSVSILYALGADPRLADAFREATAETMAEVEREMATRVRKGGQDVDRTTGNMIWTDFLHHTSRPIDGMPDPQLHIHAVVFNATFDREEMQWKAGQFGGIKKDAPYFQAAFRARLANKVQALGYEIERKRDDFEITGVSARALSEFSRRAELIDKKAKELGIIRPESKAKLGATTRQAKTDGLTWDDLLRLWSKRLPEKDLQAIHATKAKATRPIPTLDLSREAVDWSLRHLLERNSTISQRELVTTALKHGLGHVTPEGILHEVATRKDLIRRELNGIELVTTQAVLNEEKAIITFAQKGKGRYRPLGPASMDGRGPDSIPAGSLRSAPEDLPAHLHLRTSFRAASASPDIATLSPAQQAAFDARERGAKSVVSLKPADQVDNLSPTQAAAVRHAWSSRDRLILIRGAAGTGKTTLTKALLAGVDAPYVVLAPSAEASRGVLRREGVDPNADTLAKFLTSEEMQENVRSGLIVLDEASLTGAHDLAKLTELADQLSARLLLLGDRRQHKSVARGDVLSLLEDKAGIKVATVGEIRRQSGEYKQAVKLASDGKTADAFERLDKLGWIKEGHDALVEDYMQGLKAGKSQLVIAPTHAEGDAVTAKLRDRLREEGMLRGEDRHFTRLENAQLTEAERSDPETLRQLAGAEAQFVKHSKRARAGTRVTITAENADELAKEGSRFVVYRPRELELAEGDTIRITANGKTADGEHRLNNGAVYQVAGFTDKGDIRLDNGWSVGKGWGHVEHGLVSTSHAAQGRTTDRVLVAQSSQSFPASDKSQFYVSVSRGRQQALIYTDDREALREAIVRERPRVLATELVRRPRQKLRERMKKGLAFLRQVASLQRMQEAERLPTQQRDIAFER